MEVKDVGYGSKLRIQFIPPKSSEEKGKEPTLVWVGVSFLIFCVAIRVTYSIYGIKLLRKSLLKLLTIYLNYNFTKMWSTQRFYFFLQDKLLWLCNRHPEILPTNTSLLPSSSSHRHHPTTTSTTIIITHNHHHHHHPHHHPYHHPHHQFHCHTFMSFISVGHTLSYLTQPLEIIALWNYIQCCCLGPK